jgi:hypothetical protein
MIMAFILFSKSAGQYVAGHNFPVADCGVGKSIGDFGTDLFAAHIVICVNPDDDVASGLPKILAPFCGKQRQNPDPVYR